MGAYYNEFEPAKAHMLRALMADRLIMDGIVDDRPIQEVQPADLTGFTRWHFFAGIGGWDMALQMANWPEDRPVCTASLPCQPFSSAGKRKGFEDERHLWPVFAELVGKCGFATIFGEQVEAAIRLGWLDRVFASLEQLDYACAAACIPAASLGAPHIRQRLFWVADSQGIRHVPAARPEQATKDRPADQDAGTPRELQTRPCGPGGTVGLADANGRDASTERQQRSGEQRQQPDDGTTCRLGNAPSIGLEEQRPQRRGEVQPDGTGEIGGPWSDTRTILCRDGKARRVCTRKDATKPILQFMANGISCTMGLGYDQCLDATKERIIHHGKEAKARPGEILRAMWETTLQASLRESQRLGRYGPLSGPQILLIALCRLARDSHDELDIPTRDITEIQEGTVRAMRGETEELETAPCSPQERRLDGPQSGEPGNALHRLPPGAGTLQDAAEEVQVLRNQRSPERDVSKALSEMEEVWRPVFDKAKEEGNAKRLRDCKRTVIATDCFPLAARLPGRVHLLRGAGDAIVPPVAAAFIEAYCEARGE